MPKSSSGGELPVPLGLPAQAEADHARGFVARREAGTRRQHIAPVDAPLAQAARREHELVGRCPVDAHADTALVDVQRVDVDHRVRDAVGHEREHRFGAHPPVDRAAAGGAAEIACREIGVGALRVPQPSAQAKRLAQGIGQRERGLVLLVFIVQEAADARTVDRLLALRMTQLDADAIAERRYVGNTAARAEGPRGVDCAARRSRRGCRRSRR